MNHDEHKPNIIFILTDQQRYDTIAALGHPHMTTPNMDRLVRHGVSFQNAFCPGATCVASRSAIFTGMYAHNTGTYSFNAWSHHRTWVHELADHGYHCVNIGKMHVVPTYDNLGFHERVVVENPQNKLAVTDGREDEWGRYLSMHDKTRPQNRQRLDPDWKSKYQGVPWHMEEHLHSDVFVGHSALAWIRRHRPTKPVFLQIGFPGPHEVYDPLPRHYEWYEHRDVPKPVIKEGELAGKPPQHTAHQDYFSRADGEAQVDLREATEDDIVRMRRHYYAKVTTVDEQLGKVLDALEQSGYLEHAIVVFASDHGDMLGDHRLPYKWLMYESVVRVPLIVWDTRNSKSGSSDQLVSLIDIGPSLLEAAGIPVPAYLDGRSFMPLVHGRSGFSRDYVLCEDNYLTMIRNRQYKMIYYTGQEDDGELYDLHGDPNEWKNVFHDPAYADVKRELQLELLHGMLRSNYAHSMYKNRGSEREWLWPQDSKYLHVVTKINPDRWYRL